MRESGSGDAGLGQFCLEVPLAPSTWIPATRAPGLLGRLSASAGQGGELGKRQSEGPLSARLEPSGSSFGQLVEPRCFLVLLLED